MSFTPAQIELASTVLGFFFTVALLSYLINDNPLYRLALHIFVGVAIGYVTLIALYQVIVPRLVEPARTGDSTAALLALGPLLLFVLLIFKLSPRTAQIGNLSIAFLIGIGTAVAVGGAVTGTLIPQVGTTWLSFLPSGDNPLMAVNHIVIVIGTIATLVYFQFWLRGQTSSGAAGRIPVINVIEKIGQVFLVITLGVIFGGMILSGIAVLSEQIATYGGWVAGLLP